MATKYINFPQNTFDQKYLAKMLPLDRAFESLDMDSLWFTNPEKWVDPYESYFLNNSFGNHDCILKGRVLSTCFTTTGRSEAQWKAYSDKEISLMIEIPAVAFVNHLQSIFPPSVNIYVCKVRYVPTWRLKKLNSWEILDVSQATARQYGEEELCIRLMSLKRKPYAYENEIRFFIVFPEELQSSELDGKYLLGTLSHGLVNKITISPLAGKATKSKLKQYLLRNHYKASVSSLYDNVTNQVIVLP